MISKNNPGLLLLFLVLPVTLGSAQVALTRIDGSVSTADSVSIADGRLITGDTQVDVNEYRLIDFQREVKPTDSLATVGLVGGGQIGASQLQLTEEVFLIENVAGQIRLGVDAVTQIRFRKEELPLFASAKPKDDVDQLFVRIKGAYQIVPGIVETISESSVKIFYDDDIIEFKMEDAYGLILAQDAEREQAEVNGVVYLVEGSRLSCQLKSLSADRVVAVVGGVADVEIPTEVVSRVEIRSDRLAFLSDLGPKSVVNQKGAVFLRKWQKDRNISGGKLVLRDREKRLTRNYAKGLGTKSGMKLVFDNRGFDRFVSTVGIDATTNGNGLCVIRVLADGAEVFASPVAGTDAPRTLDVDISGKDEIVLSIEFGDDFLDLSDHLNWCDARFVKTTD
ncbi:MAG: NPCBM/NEW2 domain-containing protein [Planctomycetota bacterium]|nr:NPCBM/NEW2 domain-containing protein [Planctomycetota bacterium]